MAGACAVGKAFECERGLNPLLDTELDLWPSTDGSDVPRFRDVFLPGALWLIGLGNLGQAFLWTLSALPYADPAAVSLVLQDCDKVSEENWATSVLVRDETYGWLKTKVGENWATAKGFDVRRVDRNLLSRDRLEDNDPRIALSGVDKMKARTLMAAIGFDCIVDAGLGRTSTDFDRYRVTIFDQDRPIQNHFSAQKDRPIDEAIFGKSAYQRLETELGRCGMTEVAGASVAVPYVSAVAAAITISRLIAIVSGCKCPVNEVGRISKLNTRRLGPVDRINARGARHVGKPRAD